MDLKVSDIDWNELCLVMVNLTVIFARLHCYVVAGADFCWSNLIGMIILVCFGSRLLVIIFTP